MKVPHYDSDGHYLGDVDVRESTGEAVHVAHPETHDDGLKKPIDPNRPVLKVEGRLVSRVQLHDNPGTEGSADLAVRVAVSFVCLLVLLAMVWFWLVR